MNSNPVVKIEGHTKTFKSGMKKPFRALNNLSLEISENEIFGYVGGNGAGKTTTFKILLGLLFADSGSIKLWDILAPNVNARTRLGYLPENPYFYPYLTGEECLDFYAGMFDMDSKSKKSRINEMLSLVSLEHARKRQVRKFSRGMLQRLGIAQALINDPDLLILDEPMSGLDPMGRKDMRDIIINCREKGKTVLFSSHILSDVEMICDRAGIIANGVLEELVTVDDILNRQSAGWEIIFTGDPVDIGLGDRPDGTTTAQKLPAENTFVIKAADKDVAYRYIRMIQDQGGELKSFNPLRNSLEEIYVKKAAVRDS